MKIVNFCRLIGACLLSLFFSLGVSAQVTRTVKGVVSDGNEPLAGVSVIEIGTLNGTSTDVDGTFSLTVREGAKLEISFIGFATQEVSVIPGKTEYVITLKEDDVWLNEVVVVGYGVQQKKLVTGATLQVKGEDVERLNTTSVLGALQSQTPGVYITQSSGQVGESYRINIRGLGTASSNEPLYVIDGVPGGSINSLNPSDIESIDILKDAASAAIYGARAANGVLLVTTKQGKAGKTKVSYDGYMGWQNPITNGVRPANAKEYMKLVNDAFLTQDPTGGLLYDWSKELPADLLAAINNGTWNGTNWLKESTVENAPITSHALNLTGGSDYSRFAMGFSYLDQTGTIGYPATPKYSRYTARINSQHSLWKKNGRDIISFGENVVFSNYDRKGVQIGSMYSNNIRNLLKMTPLLPAYNKDGDYYILKDMQENNWTFDQAVNNPLAQLDYTRNSRNNITRRLQSNAYLEISPIKDMTFRSSVGYHFSQNSSRSYVAAYTLSAKTANPTDDVTQSQSWSGQWTLENTLNYNFSFNNHHFNTLLGQSVEKWGYGESVSAKNSFSLFPGSFDHAYIDNTQGLDTTNSSMSGGPNTAGSIASFFGRINYNHQEKYLASLVMRADGSSNFMRGNRWGYFPSVSAGWVITEEDFMEKNSNWLNFLKLRGSWGQNGNCNISNFQYLATIAFNTNAYYYDDKGTPATAGYPDLLANKDVTWETSEQIDLGFDARFLRSRLGVNFDWYRKMTKDWLVVAPTLLLYGAGAPYINGGDVRNQGMELAFTWNDKIGKDFTYGASLNLAHNENKVMRIANSEGIIHGPEAVIAENTDESFRVEVGYPMGYFYGYKTLGVFQNQKQIDKWLADGNAVRQDSPKPGDLIFFDANGDGEITTEDRTMIGNPHPKYTGSLNFNASYKGFDISLTTYGAFGMQILKSYRSFSDTPNDNYTNKDMTKYWNGEGSTNKYPAFAHGKNVNFIDISDIYVEDADYVKFSNITLGYDFSKGFKKLPVSKLRMYVTAQNLLTITGYSGMDPEIGFSADRNWASGIDAGYYPSSRTILVGMNITF
jgi:TonB-linked SusC/RagA family outer membrane protein